MENERLAVLECRYLYLEKEVDRLWNRLRETEKELQGTRVEMARLRATVSQKSARDAQVG